MNIKPYHPLEHPIVKNSLVLSSDTWTLDGNNYFSTLIENFAYDYVCFVWNNEICLEFCQKKHKMKYSPMYFRRTEILENVYYLLSETRDKDLAYLMSQIKNLTDSWRERQGQMVFAENSSICPN